MSFHTINGINTHKGFNNYRFDCNNSKYYGYNYDAMSKDGSVIPGRGYQDPNPDRGKFIQQQDDTTTEKKWYDYAWDFALGAGIALQSCGSAIGTMLSAIINGDDGKA